MFTLNFTSTCIFSSYKLAQIVRRFVLVNHTDPSSRDHNGFMTGSYYVGVYGWCTSDEFVTNNKTDGPCSFAANTIYNVTVEVNYSKSITSKYFGICLFVSL